MSRPAGAGGPARFQVRAFGCQMNVYDAERMSESLAAAGHVAAAPGDEADILVLNTCHIREKAAERAYSEVGRAVAHAHDAGRPRPIIVLAGCVAQAEGEEVRRRQPHVDVVVGPQALHRLPGLVDEARAGRPSVALSFEGLAKLDGAPRRPARRRQALLTVQEGCDKFCAFCVVPYTRGAEVSRPLDRILEEARALIAAGALEITLIGQNVNAWSHGGHDFGALLSAVAQLPGLVRLRYTTSHPRDVSAGQVEAHARLDRLMPYVHLPVQSGSDRMLAAMNRRHDRAFFLSQVARLRRARPGLALSGDFITGFPGETQEDFAHTLSIVEEAGFAQAYSFAYSPRPGTPAAERADAVPREEAHARLLRLQQVIESQALAFNRSFAGRQVEVLIERPGRQPGQWLGKSPWMQSVVVDAPGLAPGDLVSVAITGAGPAHCRGRLAAGPAHCRGRLAAGTAAA